METNEQGGEGQRLLNELEIGLTSAREMPGGLFPCIIAQEGLVTTSGSVQRLTNEFYDMDAGRMCANIVADLVIDQDLLDS